MLIEEIKLENKLLEVRNKVKFLEIYENKELEGMEKEIKEILNSKYLTSSETNELKNISFLISYEKIRREKWKIDYFYHTMGTTFILGFVLGSLTTKALLDYDLKKFVEYLQTIKY